MLFSQVMRSRDKNMPSQNGDMRFPLWVVVSQTLSPDFAASKVSDTGQFCKITIICACQQFPLLTGGEEFFFVFRWIL